MVIACAGYRVTAKTGHHKVAFDAITLSANASNTPTTSRDAVESGT